MVNQTVPVTGTMSLSHLCPLPPVLSLLEPTAHVCTPKMAEDGLRLTVPLPTVCPQPCINLLFLSPSLFIWQAGAGGHTWHMESQEFGPWIQNSGSRPLTGDNTWTLSVLSGSHLERCQLSAVNEQRARTRHGQTHITSSRTVLESFPPSDRTSQV
jgi:hypothetical protein